MAVDFKVNGRAVSVDVPDGTRLLWVLRERLKLTGTKYGCGVAQCGACMVHVDGQPTFSCQTPTEAVRGRAITTIEGLSRDGMHPVQRAWLAERVPQCGYCQSGQIMNAAALLARNPRPTGPRSSTTCRPTSAGAGPTSGSCARSSAQCGRAEP